MKKLFVSLFLLSTFAITAQNSVLLRIKYKTGDKYKMSMTQKVTSSAVAMNSSTDIVMDVKSQEKDVYDVEMKIGTLKMDMLQNGMQFSYDSTKKDEELDDTGKLMKQQMGPMLKAIISVKMNSLGKTLETKVTPNIPGVDQFTNSTSSIPYPEKAVSVGSEWTDTKEQQGTKTVTTYKVTKITSSSVFLEISGKINGMGSGTLKGTIEVDRATGNPIKSTIKSAMTVQGQDMDIDVNLSTTKI